MNIFEYIAEDSFPNAEKVIDAIEATANSLPKNPDRFPPDKYKKMNNGSYRCFTKYRYRVSYHIGKKDIKIIRVRYASRKATMYQTTRLLPPFPIHSTVIFAAFKIA